MNCKKDEKITSIDLDAEENKNEDEIKIIDNVNSVQVSENMITTENTHSKVTPVSTSQPASVVPIRPRVVFLPKLRKVPTNSSDIAQVSGGQFVMRSGQQFISALTAVPASVAKSVNATTPIILPSTGTSMITGKPQIMLQAPKSLNNSIRNIVPVSVSTPNGPKQQFAYLGTIIKPVIGPNGKSSENQILTHLPVGLVPTPTNQKLVLTSLGGNQKLSTTSRRISTDTKSSSNIMQAKITNVILPATNTSTVSKTKSQTPVINLKITNGQLQKSDHEGAITVLQENNTSATPKLPPLQPLTKISSLSVNTVITNSVSERKSTDNEKEYTLSIPESDTNFLDADSSFELSIKENSTDSVEVTCTISNSKENKDTCNKEQQQQTQTAKANDQDPSNNNIPEQPMKKIHEVAILKKPKLFQDTEWKKTRTDLNTNIKITNKDSDDNNSVNIVTMEPVPQSEQNINDNITDIKRLKTPKTVSERRRKSHNTVLKDYDEIEFTPALSPDYEEQPMIKYKSNADITFKKLSIRDELVAKSKVAVDDIQIEVIKKELPPAELTSDEDFDPAKLLEWNDGIGSLPGSDLKFTMNEFGFMQMVTDADIALIKVKRETDLKIMNDLSNMIESKIPKKNSSTDVFCCEVCGCYGYGSEFVNSMFCSYTCSEKYITKGIVDSKYNRKKEKKLSVLSNCKIENDAQRSESVTPAQSDEDTNDTLENKYTYPWLGGKKGFSWAKYLAHVNAKAAPVKLFKDPYPYMKNGFKVGMKLEGIDPQHPSYYCVLTVVEVLGYRIRLHFDGYPDSHDFWTNADSLDIFPAGWCDKNNHKLHPPFGYLQSTFNWNTYLKQCKAQPAPRNLFLNRPEISPCPNGFRLGMKLEAVDRKNSSLVCVATVADIMDNRILVHFDSWDDIYDYWADPSSPYIHPVGWCEEKGHSLTPPNNYKDPNEFTWEAYLKETRSQAAPARAFKQRPANGFKKGMRLECVDRRVPKLIRVATVDDVRDHQIRISFDGWPDKYSYWIDDDGHDIHPVGWCQKTGHPLQPPLTPEDIYSTECSTPGCRGIGNIKGPQYENHQSVLSCPYSEQNYDKDFSTDRLLGCTKEKIDEAVPLSKEPKRHAADSTTTKLGRPPKIRRPYYNESDDEWQANDKMRKKKRKHVSSPEQDESSNNFTSKIRVLPDSVLIKGVTQDNFDPVLIPDPNKLTPFHWDKHSKNLNCYVGDITDPRTWCEQKVVDFIGSIPSCKEHSTIFSKHKIDGEALLMLSQNDLTSLLGFKLGPAIKLYNSIMLLRDKVLKYY